MDRKAGNESGRWSWLPERMPRVADLIKRQRAALGDDHVNECWRRGVVGGEPGWFFAWERGLGVGAPWPEALQVVPDLDPAAAFPDKAFLILRPKEAGYGAH